MAYPAATDLSDDDDRLFPPGSSHLKKGKACHACRRSKMKCDAKRPHCDRCKHRGVTCAYDPKGSTRRRGPDRQPGCRLKPVFIEHKPERTNTSTASLRRSWNDESSVSSGSSSRSSLVNSRKGSMAAPSIALNDSFSPVSSASSPTLCSSESPTFVPKSSPIPAETTIPLAAHISYSPEACSPDTLPPPSPSNWVSRTSYSDVPDYPIALDEDQEYLDSAIIHVTSTSYSTGITSPGIMHGPSVRYHSKTWWDRLLEFYSPNPKEASRAIFLDLSYLFRTSDHALSFVHVPSYYQALSTRHGREDIQPSVVFACLAFSTLTQSSEAGFGHYGRQKALALQDVAQASLQAAIDSHRIDPSLAQAALIIAIFETCPHPDYSETRCVSALRQLDQIIQALGLCYSDVDSPIVSVFPPQLAPVLPKSHNHTPVTSQDLHGAHGNGNSSPHPHQTGSVADACSCTDISLVNHSGLGMGWLGSPSWDKSWSEATIKQEQNRRVCWSALRIICARTLQEATASTAPLPFFIAQPSNYAILFPGESLIASNVANDHAEQAGKESVWALYSRGLLLWGACAAMYTMPMDDVRRQWFAQQVSDEAEVIETALAKHSCDTEKYNGYVGRYFLENARMGIQYGFQCFLPTSSPRQLAINRIEARTWMVHYRRFLPLTIGKLSDRTIRPLMRRPFAVWYLLRIWERAIIMWELDDTATDALDVAIAIMAIQRAMRDLYPSSYYRNMIAPLEARTKLACDASGVPFPPAVPIRELFPPEFRTESDQTR